ncbi:MAG: rhomboid family intramembrane serine protease [Deltaproteobacteria bacterium]|nr:rhomboid family intramembrane serine protease [Deltaproteobacteria bacterium]
MIPLRDSIPSSRTPSLNYLIIIINVVIFFLEISLGRSQLEQVVMTFGFVPQRFLNQLRDGNVVASFVPVFTSMFLHGGWLHLIGNMWTLFIFGDNIEDTFGHGRFLLFYLSCGVVAALAQLAVAPHSSMPMVGASGAIAGIMGAYFTLFPHARVLTLVPIVFFVIIEIPAYVFLGLWFLLQFFSGTVAIGVSGAAEEIRGGVAFWAHIGGFATGFLVVLFFLRGGFLADRQRQSRRA